MKPKSRNYNISSEAQLKYTFKILLAYEVLDLVILAIAGTRIVLNVNFSLAVAYKVLSPVAFDKSYYLAFEKSTYNVLPVTNLTLYFFYFRRK